MSISVNQRFLYLSVILFLCTTLSYGINEDSDTIRIKTKKYVKYLDLRFENGIMLSNGKPFSDELVDKSYYTGMDFRLGFRLTDPDNVYSNVYRRPTLGIGFYTSTFHNEDIGKPNAVYFYFNIPFTFEKNRKFTFAYSGAFGLSYNFNPYDSIDNPSNYFIGSKNNCYFHFGFLVGYRLSDRFLLSFTTGLKHFSNGSFKKPNSGINLIPFTVGIKYKINKEDILLEKRAIPKFKPFNIWNISFAAGSKHYDMEDARNYLKMTYSVNYLRQFNYKIRLGGGLDVFYSAHHGMSNIDGNKKNAISVAVVGDYEWVMNKNLSVPIAFGVYLFRHEGNEEITPFYERVGMKYRFNNNIFAAITIKAHRGKADYFEWTIGYSINRDKNKY